MDSKGRMPQKEDEVTTRIERYYTNSNLFDDMPWLWAITTTCDSELEIIVAPFDPAVLSRPTDEGIKWWVKTEQVHIRECVFAIKHDSSRNLAADIEHTVTLVAGLEIQFLVLDDRTDFTRKLTIYRPRISGQSLADLCAHLARSP